VSGRQLRSGALALRVGGSAAAHGRVEVSRRGRLTGRLGGRRVRAQLANGVPGQSGRLDAFAAVARVSPPSARP